MHLLFYVTIVSESEQKSLFLKDCSLEQNEGADAALSRLPRERRPGYQKDQKGKYYHNQLHFLFLICAFTFKLLLLQVQSFMRGWLCRRKWKIIVQDYICSPHAESMRKRNQIVFNMVEAETEYVNTLCLEQHHNLHLNGHGYLPMEIVW